MDDDKFISIKAKQDIPIGHKIALEDMKTGDTVWKYGVDIGKVVANIKARESGRVGIRNHVIVLPVDDLSNAAAEAVAHNMKGALAIPHPDGSLQIGADLDLYFRTLIEVRRVRYHFRLWLQPTTDPAVGIQGLMLPVGAASSPKSAMLALMVEILFSALIGAQFSDEASIFFIDGGNQPGIGQTFILVDAEALAGRAGYLSRLDEMVAMMQNDPKVRLLGKRRLDLERQSRREGIEVSAATLKTLGMNL
jgi:hypothetical protein